MLDFFNVRKISVQNYLFPLQEVGEMLNTSFPNHTRAFCELNFYLYDSFGNPTRIDYGTGHEMAFCMFLSCLFKVGILFCDDKVAVVAYVFSK